MPRLLFAHESSLHATLLFSFTLRPIFAVFAQAITVPPSLVLTVMPFWLHIRHDFFWLPKVIEVFFRFLEPTFHAFHFIPFIFQEPTLEHVLFLIVIFLIFPASV